MSLLAPIIIPKPSAHAHRLSEKISRCIQDEHKATPNLTYEDVRQACGLVLTVASSQFGKSHTSAQNIAIGMVILMGLLSFGMAFTHVSLATVTHAELQHHKSNN